MAPVQRIGMHACVSLLQPHREGRTYPEDQQTGFPDAAPLEGIYQSKASPDGVV